MPNATAQASSPPLASARESQQLSRAQTRPWRPGPLAGRYPAVAAMVVLFLVPYLVLSSALGPLTPLIGGTLHLSPQELSLAWGLANAGYAVGTVLAVQFAQHLPQRRMMLIYATLLVAGSILAAAATGPAMFIAGHVLQGLCTSLLLIAAAPPLFLGYPAAKLRWTAMIMNMCIFGAVAAGPLIGGAQASFHAWRPLFWIVAGIAVVALLLSLLTFEDAPPADRSAPWDGWAVGLAATGSVAAFLGAAELTTHRFLDPVAVAPLLGGLALIVILWIYQYRGRRTLLTLRPLASTIPLTGIVLAVCAAAASVSAIALTSVVLAPHYTPLHLGLLYLPELGGAVITAIAFGAVFSTRYIHYYALAGMVFLALGILVIRTAVPPTTGLAAGRFGADRRGRRRLGDPGAVPGRVLAALGQHPARVRHPRTAARDGRVHDRPDPAALRDDAVRAAHPGHGHRVVGLLRAVGRRRAGRRAALPARWGAAGGAVADPVPGWRRAGVGLPAAAGRDPPEAAMTAAGAGPVVFAYDGSDLAEAAIAEAGRQLRAGRDALVLTIWEPFNVGFVPVGDVELNAAEVDQVRKAAEQTAAHGAALAGAAGFQAQSMAAEAAPTWRGIVDAADQHDASLIVLGSHGRSGLAGAVVGSVASAVAAHSRRSVLIVHGEKWDSLP